MINVNDRIILHDFNMNDMISLMDVGKLVNDVTDVIDEGVSEQSRGSGRGR